MMSRLSFDISITPNSSKLHIHCLSSLTITCIVLNHTVCPCDLQVAALGVPYILMHMRGNPTTMTSKQNTSYDCTWRDVGNELQAHAERAMAAGVPGWGLIMDPGELCGSMR